MSTETGPKTTTATTAGAEAEAPLLPGYRDGKLLGKGGYALVYLYRDESSGLDVAVKVLQLLDESARSQFADEVRVLSSFNDEPLIVRFVRQGTLDDGRPYVVMEYCAGGSLSKWIGEQGLPVTQVVAAGLRIGRALEAVHRKHWLHRDIKPSNILVDGDGGSPQLSDFGIACPSRNGEAGPGDPAVSVAWSAPEVISKDSTGSVASDVYSLGATLWHLLAGHAPYEIPGGDNTAEALERRVVGSRLPGLGRDGVPTALERLLRSMLDKEPAARPRTAAGVVAVLELIEAQLQVSAAPVQTSVSTATSDVGAVSTSSVSPATQRTDEPVVAAKKGRRVLIAAAAVVVIGGGLGVAGGLSGHGTSEGTHASQASPGASASAPGAQDAGLLGEAVPPGTPAVSATQVNASTLRFSWTYSAPEATDTFAWRAVGGSRSGESGAAAIELSDPAGQRLCIQVRVLRAGGGDAGSAWSSADCGS